MTNYKQFHDGIFEGLWIPSKGTVNVYLSTSERERTTVLLTGVVMVKVTGFKEGNIIFDVTTRDGDEITLLDIADLYDLRPDHQPAAWEHQLLEKAQKQGFQLFQINPSYGGSCLMLSEAVELMKNDRKGVGALA